MSLDACPAITLVAPGRRSAGGQAVQAEALASHFAAEGADVAFVDSNPALPPHVRLLEHLPYARTLAREAVYLGDLRRIASDRVMIAFSAAHVSFLAQVFGFERRLRKPHAAGQVQDLALAASHDFRKVPRWHEPPVPPDEGV